MTLDGNGNVVTTDDYYPFGLTLPGRSYNIALTGNQYKYSGKELDEEGGLDWYYFGARYYDAEIGRFLSIDPHASSYPDLTPYHYAGNNSIAFIDPTGMDSLYYSRDGRLVNVVEGGDDIAFVQSFDEKDKYFPGVSYTQLPGSANDWEGYMAAISNGQITFSNGVDKFRISNNLARWISKAIGVNTSIGIFEMYDAKRDKGAHKSDPSRAADINIVNGARWYNVGYFGFWTKGGANRLASSFMRNADESASQVITFDVFWNRGRIKYLQIEPALKHLRWQHRHHIHIGVKPGY